jgi:hypothetical protein
MRVSPKYDEIHFMWKDGWRDEESIFRALTRPLQPQRQITSICILLFKPRLRNGLKE